MGKIPGVLLAVSSKSSFPLLFGLVICFGLVLIHGKFTGLNGGCFFFPKRVGLLLPGTRDTINLTASVVQTKAGVLRSLQSFI